MLIAFHYPPCSVSSGLQRTLCFSRDLDEFGWRSTVLTANRRAYRETREDQLAQIPPDVSVHRAFALDTLRHLGIRGRHLGWMALPDPWVTWIMGAVPTGLRLIRNLKPDVIWSTYPVATAHLVGMILHRLTGVPWVADFRDPMIEIDPITQQRFPADRRLWSVRQWVEQLAIQHCQRAVFVTPGALEIYRQRYPEHSERMSVIANGYDEETFSKAEHANNKSSRRSEPYLLVHSGTLYPGPDRDASAFLAALAQLRIAGRISSSTVRVHLRATGYDAFYRDRIALHGVGDMVKLVPALPYQDALAEMLEADGLLLFQGATSNPAVPAKLYEYIRARRPIFALADDRGETAKVLRDANIGTLVPLDSPERIAAGLVDFLRQVRSATAPVASSGQIERFSRKNRAMELALILESVCDPACVPEPSHKVPR